MLSRDLILKLISNRSRTDGRELNQFSEVYIWINGSTVKVKAGETMLLVSVSADLVAPFKHNMGIVSLHVADPLISKLLETCINDCIDLESLCYISGEKVWNINIRINVLNNGGNILDIAHMAVLIAVRLFKRPHLSITGEYVDFSVHSGHPLPVIHMPFFTTFVFNGDVFLMDPTTCEEELCQGRLFIATNKLGEVCGCHIDGSLPPSLQLASLVEKSIGLSTLLAQKLEDVLNKHNGGQSLMGEPYLFWNGKEEPPTCEPVSEVVAEEVVEEVKEDEGEKWKRVDLVVDEI